MAEALVSAVMEQIVSILTQQAEEGIRLIMGADAEVQKLKRSFSAIQSLLEDAESKQVKEKAVRDWLEKLRDVSYDIDDVLDEWNTVIQKLRVKEVEKASKPLRKVCSLLPCYGFCCRIVLRYDIVMKIKNLNGRLDVIAEEKDRFNFNPTDGTQNLERLITTSDIDVSEVFGRDDEKEALLNLLLSESSQGPSIPIVSIVGMGGIGKTTLAQFAYSDDKVKAHFNEKIWVCVSEPFDQIRIAKAILESLKNEAPNLNELETIMRNIRQSIEGKKFLLVLDDVWTEDPKNWETLKHSLMHGCSGSKILVTTRKESVANVIKTTHMIGVKTLPEKESWKLFSHLAFFDRSMEECEELQYIGEKIVNRCKGLPLAVRTLGSLLRFKREIKEWQSILESEMWEVEEVEKGLFPPLLLSYFDLPSILKKCFMYCAIFPKDYEIGKHELIRLWMSQGYLKAKPSEDEELVGEKYFKILAMRSFFQDFKKDDDAVDIDIVSCKMHDIVHDCAQFLTKNECFTLDLDDSKEILLESYENARHLFIISKRQIQLPTYIYKMKRMHTIVVKFDFNLVDYINLPNLFNQLTCLRTLDLSGDSIKDIPIGIRKLIHLRYLNISDNPMIRELPETLCDLYNLQILNIEWCPLLENLPQGMGKLINLRCLFLDETSISYMPKGVERLTNLQRLQYFVGGDTGYGNKVCKLECLKNFNHLKSLGIKRLGNLTDVDNLRRAELNNKGRLLELYLNFEGTVYEDHEVLLESVQPPLNLETLRIEEHRGKTIFPNWLMSLTKLRVLRLNNCINCEHLPPLGKLPSLEALYIRQLESIRRVGNEFLGIESSSSSASSFIAFRKLKLLMLEFLNELEEWDYGITETGSEQSVKIMPCIRTLRIYFCGKLKSLPSHLLPITKSKICDIYKCPLLEQYLDEERQPLSPSSLQDCHQHHLTAVANSHADQIIC